MGGKWENGISRLNFLALVGVGVRTRSLAFSLIYACGSIKGALGAFCASLDIFIERVENCALLGDLTSCVRFSHAIQKV